MNRVISGDPFRRYFVYEEKGDSLFTRVRNSDGFIRIDGEFYREGGLPTPR